jgi:hypothetical protein
MPKKKMTAMQKKMYLLRQMRGKGGNNSKSKVTPYKNNMAVNMEKAQALNDLRNKVAVVMHVREAMKNHYPSNIKAFINQHSKRK